MSKDYGSKIDLNPQTSVARINKVEAADFNDIATDMENVENEINEGIINSNTVGAKYYFNSSTKYIDIGTDSLIRPTDIITVSAWINPITVTSIKPILGETNNNSFNNGYLLYIRDGYACFGINNVLSYKASIPFDKTFEWSHIVGTYNKLNGEINVYLNGVKGTSRVYSSSITYSGQSLRISRGSGLSVYVYQGQISNVKIFNTALSDTDVLQLYKSGRIPFKYNGADGIEITSGTLTKYKSYRIKSNSTGDFTNCGSADNVAGTEFIATSSTPIDWGDGVLVQNGCVVDCNQSGIGGYSWIDNSSNGLHGGVSIAGVPIDYKIGDRRTAYLIDTAPDPIMTDVIPVGWKVNSITIETTNTALTNVIAVQEDGETLIATGTGVDVGDQFMYVAPSHSVNSVAKDISFTLTSNGGTGTKIYVEMEKVK